MRYVFRIGPYGPSSQHAGKCSYVALLHEEDRAGIEALVTEAGDAAGLDALLPKLAEAPLLGAELADEAARRGLQSERSAPPEADLAASLTWWRHALTLSMRLASGIPVPNVALLMALVSAGGAFEAEEARWKERFLVPFDFELSGAIERTGVGHVVIGPDGPAMFLFADWAAYQHAQAVVGADLDDGQPPMESLVVTYDRAPPSYQLAALAHAGARHLPQPIRTTRQATTQKLDLTDLWTVTGVLQAAADLGLASEVASRVELSDGDAVDVRLRLRALDEPPVAPQGGARA